MRKVEGTDGYVEWGNIHRAMAMVEIENDDLGSRAANRNKRPTEKPRQVALIML